MIKLSLANISLSINLSKVVIILSLTITFITFSQIKLSNAIIMLFYLIRNELKHGKKYSIIVIIVSLYTKQLCKYWV